MPLALLPQFAANLAPVISRRCGGLRGFVFRPMVIEGNNRLV